MEKKKFLRVLSCLTLILEPNIVTGYHVTRATRKYYPNFLKALNMIDHTYNLVSHIYGPYPHHVLFGKKFPVAGQIPVLSNLQMLCDGKPVG